MRRQAAVFFAAALLAFGSALPANAVQPPSAEQYYAQAIRAMRDVPQPDYATYDVHVHVTGLGFMLTRDPSGEASIGLVTHDKRAKPDATFPAAYRKSDDLTSVETPQGWGIISAPVFDPTWSGVNDWIRYGINGRPDLAASTDATTILPRPSPAARSLRTIATVETMGVAFYNVSDGGAATCANGDSAHRVHLIARRDPLDHPLTDAMIDTRTSHLCRVRLEMRQSIVAAGYTSAIELNIADVNGESLVRSGWIDLTIRAMGVGVKRITVAFTYDDFAFPPTLAGEIFPPPKSPTLR